MVRLTYQAGIATTRALEANYLSEMLRDPLLRSTRTVQALFHRAAIVAEADSDRAFYDEMNRRLQMNDRGIRDAIFLNAQNVQTIHRLVRPLRRIGIPAAAVVDLDFIKNSKRSIEQLFEACQVDAARFDSLYADLTDTADAFAHLEGAIKKPGLAALPTAARTRADNVLRELSRYGLFLVPSGEVESFLSDLHVTSHGSKWLVKIFSRIGQTEEDLQYLKPSTGDVWGFLDNIANWVDDPSRLGTA